MHLLAPFIFCLVLWAGPSTAVIPGGGKDGAGCWAGCSGCLGKWVSQQGTSLAGLRESLGRGARGCSALQGLQGAIPAFLDSEMIFPSGARFLLVSGLGLWKLPCSLNLQPWIWSHPTC